ncbi:hypothetical protein SS50377_28204 [Spironucleus salmonicida]|uniref:Uncharacterized protein n=1 Tax=Spironucleus salmonicida TaxID=348837 RepID=V6LNV8_9EUKA|nr:hypothetical protein SS50377_28204 [Spironucleus salmonicida]|eukprot:EST46357.1 Hypothetical protein SS50377_13600 [Spironucleus salmonicida]
MSDALASFRSASEQASQLKSNVNNSIINQNTTHNSAFYSNNSINSNNSFSSTNSPRQKNQHKQSFAQNIANYQEISAKPPQATPDLAVLYEKISLKDRKIRELENEISFISDQLVSLKSASSNDQNFTILNDLTIAKTQISAQRNEIKILKASLETQEITVSRLKVILSFREKQLAIQSEKKPPLTVKKQKLSEEVKNLILANKKLSEQLFKNREKLTREQFLVLQQEKITEAVEIETRIIYEQKAEILDQMNILKQENKQQQKIIRILETEASKSIEATDSKFRKQIGELKQEILDLDSQLGNKNRQLATAQNRTRSYEQQTLIYKDVSELKSEAISRHLRNNNDLKLEMKMRNYETKSILKSASNQISEKLMQMKRENQKICQEYNILAKKTSSETRAEEKLRDIYQQLNEIKELTE